MNEQEMQEILENLASRGFKDDQLRSDIEKAEGLGLPVFSIARDKEFGDERMLYRLTFQWLVNRLGYELTAIHANHRMPIDIEQKKFGGFDTAAIDKGMSMINWKQYWTDTLEGVKLPDNYPIAIDHIDSLAQLLLSEFSQARYAAEELMYKHFPPNIYTIFSEEPERMQREYEHHYSFSLDAYPDITAELAYLIISERVDAISMHLSDLGLSQFEESDMNKELYAALKDYPQKTDLKFSPSIPGYYATMDIALELSNSWYEINGYKLSLVVLPDLIQGVFNGVDSERLDKKLGTVDWKNDKAIEYANRNKVEFPRDIDLLQEELFRMALVPGGAEAADMLMLKHWLSASYFKDLITPAAMVRFASLPVKAASFTTETTIDKAVNLLADRSVWKEDSLVQPANGIWQRLVFEADGSKSKIEDFDAISKKELERLFDMLPVFEYRKGEVLQQLLQGKPAKVEAKSGEMIYVELTKKLNGLKIFDKNSREIPFNFQLDPNWRQNQNQDLNPKASLKNNAATRNIIALDKRKGRSL